MKRKLGIFWGLVGAVAVSAMSVSASTFETLPDSGDYEKLWRLQMKLCLLRMAGLFTTRFQKG